METLDLSGKPCPIPVIEIKKRLAHLPPGERVEALVDDDIVRQNVQKMAVSLGCPFRHEAAPDGKIRLFVTAGKDRGAGGEAAAGSLRPVVAIGADGMGRGDEALGRMLLKSFIYALTETEPAPAWIFFFNGGIHLTCEGSGALADLQKLEQAGVKLGSCGACLDFHGKKEALRVGEIVNMALIVETLARAQKVINI